MDYTNEQLEKMREDFQNFILSYPNVFQNFIPYRIRLPENIEELSKMSIVDLNSIIKSFPGIDALMLLAESSPELFAYCINSGIAPNKVDPLFEALTASKCWEQALAKSLVSNLYYKDSFWKPLYIDNNLSFSEWNSRFQKYLCVAKEASIPLKFFNDARSLIYTLKEYISDKDNPLTDAEADTADSLIALLYKYN